MPVIHDHPIRRLRAGRDRRSSVALRCVAMAALLLCAASAPARAQCRPPRSSNEAKLLAFYSAPIAFGFGGTPRVLPAGAIRAGAEVAPVPTPDPAIQRTAYCYLGKPEHTRLTPVFARPRIEVGLPFGLVVEASYLPPLTVGDARPNFGSAALSRTTPLPLPILGGATALALRAQGTLGRVQGPITCNRSALQVTDPSGPCWGANPSRDTFHPNMWEFDAALGSWSASGRFGAFAGGGYASLHPRFQVGFTNLAGSTDSTRIVVDLQRARIFGGLTWRAIHRLDLSATAAEMVGTAFTWNLIGMWRFR